MAEILRIARPAPLPLLPTGLEGELEKLENKVRAYRPLIVLEREALAGRWVQRVSFLVDGSVVYTTRLFGFEPVEGMLYLAEGTGNG